jgi:hypothetical protein
MTPAEIAASYAQLDRSGVTAEERVRWLAGLTQPQPQQGGSPSKVSDEQYAAMSAAQKLDYARSFPQTPLDHGRRR